MRIYTRVCIDKELVETAVCTYTDSQFYSKPNLHLRTLKLADEFP